MRKAICTVGAIVAAAALLAGCSSSESQPTKAESRPAKSTSAPTSDYRPSSQSSRLANPGVPPYHVSAEAANPFPALVPARYFRRYPLVMRAYEIAHEMPGVIAQQPCYCHCDKFGHRSLLDCYASDHGAG